MCEDGQWSSLLKAIEFTIDIFTGSGTTYRQDKHFGEHSYSVSSRVQEIQTEIMTNGPVEGAFRVYGDFPTYRTGMLYCYSDTR